MEGLQKVADHVKKEWPHVEVLSLQMDVRKSEEVKAGLAEVVAKFGRLDVAVNNAGITGKAARVHELEETDWYNVLDINLNGVHRCQREELGIMVKQEYVWTWVEAKHDCGLRIPYFAVSTTSLSSSLF
jgi:NAD(P)-dependent dehydrogenase (short-subunit alcohol dehydrogenase family)